MQEIDGVCEGPCLRPKQRSSFREFGRLRGDEESLALTKKQSGRQSDLPDRHHLLRDKNENKRKNEVEVY